MKNKNIMRLALVTVFLLLIPLLAMQFNTGVDWSLFDFIVAGALLFGSGLAYERIARKGGNTAYRAAVGVAVAAALLLVDEVNGNDESDLLYEVRSSQRCCKSNNAKNPSRGRMRF